jgi:hypothetical protein
VAEYARSSDPGVHSSACGEGPVHEMGLARKGVCSPLHCGAELVLDPGGLGGDGATQATGKFGFAMEASLAAAKRVPLLRGMTVAFTPTMAKGKVGEMLARVVPHAGGVVLPKLPTVAQVRRKPTVGLPSAH